MAKFKVEITGIDTNRIKTLTNQENQALLKLYQDTHDKRIKDRIVEGNLKLVLSVCKRYQKRYDNMDDIFQVGVIGLIKSVDHFSLEHEVQFSTYAVPMIEGEIRRYLRDCSLVRVSRQIKDLSYQVLKEREKYINEFGSIPSVEELANKFQLPKGKILEAIDANMPLVYLSESMQGEDEDALTLLDVVPDSNFSSEKSIMVSSLKEGFMLLPTLERNIIYLRYYKNKSQVEIAKMFNISQAQVSRLEKSALRFLRKFVI